MAKVNVCMTGMLIKYQIERLIGNSASVYGNLLKRKTLGLWVWGSWGGGSLGCVLWITLS